MQHNSHQDADGSGGLLSRANSGLSVNSVNSVYSDVSVQSGRDASLDTQQAISTDCENHMVESLLSMRVAVDKLCRTVDGLSSTVELANNRMLGQTDQFASMDLHLGQMVSMGTSMERVAGMHGDMRKVSVVANQVSTLVSQVDQLAVAMEDLKSELPADVYDEVTVIRNQISDLGKKKKSYKVGVTEAFLKKALKASRETDRTWLVKKVGELVTAGIKQGFTDFDVGGNLHDGIVTEVIIVALKLVVNLYMSVLRWLKLSMQVPRSLSRS